MGELQYSVLRYEPSIVSGEKINLGVAFHYLDKDSNTDHREFFYVTKWNRVAAFDDTLNIPVLKAVMSDIGNEIGTRLSNPRFKLEEFCMQYDSELYFDECQRFSGVDPDSLSAQIDEIKRIYFQFEFDIKCRPNHEDQKKFLRKLLLSKRISYQKDTKLTGNFGDEITFDYIFGEYGIVFFNFNNNRIDNKTMNKVKAWAWNAKNNTSGLKLVVLYDLDDENRQDAKPAIDILSASAYRLVNIHHGFGDVTPLLECSVS